MTSPSGTTALFLNVLESGIYCWPILILYRRYNLLERRFRSCFHLLVLRGPETKGLHKLIEPGLLEKVAPLKGVKLLWDFAPL
jgi:hypothetical protein